MNPDVGGTLTVGGVLTATSGTPQSATINTGFTTPLQVTLTDSGGSPVPGVVITFTGPASGAMPASRQ